jgi:hypothetical protein
MSLGLIVNSIIWTGFLVLAIRLVIKRNRQKKAYRAMSLGYLFSLKYRLLRKLHGKDSWRVNE